MQRDRTHAPLLGAPLVALLILGAAEARAGDDRPDERQRARAAEILMRIEDPAHTRDWFGFDADWLETHFGIKKKHGVEWHHTLRLEDRRKLRFSVHGPVQRGVGRRHFGVGFQIQF